VLFHLDFTCFEQSHELLIVYPSLYTAQHVSTHPVNTGRQARVRPCCAPASHALHPSKGPSGCALPSRRKHALTTTITITTSDKHTADIRYEDIHYDFAIIVVACFAQLFLLDSRRYRSCIDGRWFARQTKRSGIATASQERAQSLCWIWRLETISYYSREPRPNSHA
jgi:hypothetical protein